jgi:hypothetical protein
MRRWRKKRMRTKKLEIKIQNLSERRQLITRCHSALVSARSRMCASVTVRDTLSPILISFEFDFELERSRLRSSDLSERLTKRGATASSIARVVVNLR